VFRATFPITWRPPPGFPGFIHRDLGMRTWNANTAGGYLVLTICQSVVLPILAADWTLMDRLIEQNCGTTVTGHNFLFFRPSLVFLNKNPTEFTSVKDYLFRQGRFRHLKDEDIEQIIRDRDRKWEIIRKNWRIK
jgi:hypothetical protein